MTHAIEIRNLSKRYAASGKGAPKQALDDVSLTIPHGSIYALLGPNGAGKSTLINILAGLVLKSAGTVRIYGTDIDTDPRQASANIGIVPQELNMDPFFSPRKLLDLQAGLYGVPKNERWTTELLDLVGLLDKADVYARNLSGGMRRRLMVAKAMVHRPPVLVLDEPTAGVDVELRQQLWENVRNLNRQGLTVLLTTHYLEEAEALCDRIAIITGGKIVADEDKETLLARVDAKEIRIRLDRDIADLPESLSAYAAEKEGPRTILVRYSPKDVAVGEIIHAVQSAGLLISDLSTKDSNLEDVFLQLTRKV